MKSPRMWEQDGYKKKGKGRSSREKEMRGNRNVALVMVDRQAGTEREWGEEIRLGR